MKKQHKGYFKKKTDAIEDSQDRRALESFYGVKPRHQNVFKSRCKMGGTVDINFELAKEGSWLQKYER